MTLRRGPRDDSLLELSHVTCKRESKSLDNAATMELIDEKLLRNLHFCRTWLINGTWAQSFIRHTSATRIQKSSTFARFPSASTSRMLHFTQSASMSCVAQKAWIFLTMSHSLVFVERKHS